MDDRQNTVRLIVKEILVNNHTIMIRHSIPSHPRTPPTGREPPSGRTPQVVDHGYPLRSGSGGSPLPQPSPSSGTEFLICVLRLTRPSQRRRDVLTSRNEPLKRRPRLCDDAMGWGDSNQ